MQGQILGLTISDLSHRDRLARGLARVLLALVVGIAGGATADEDAESAVLGAVNDFFQAMRSKDRTALEAAFVPEARLGTNGVGAWIEQVTTAPMLLDEVTYDETIMVDDDMAVAWTPYTIYINNELHHCGVNVFLMRRIDAAWKVLQLDDTRRRDDCPDPKRVS